MQHHWIKRSDRSKSLTIVALGWASSEGLVRVENCECKSRGSDVESALNTEHERKHSASQNQRDNTTERDILCLFDYRDLDFAVDIESYTDVILLAWSFGVWVAEQIFAGRKFSQAIAICGTPMPVSTKYGIAPRPFDLTVRGIRGGGLAKFNERICGPRLDQYLCLNQPLRPIDELGLELEILGRLSRESLPTTESSKAEQVHQPSKIAWSEAVIAEQDLIFTPQSQTNYWSENGTKTTIKPHMWHLWLMGDKI